MVKVIGILARLTMPRLNRHCRKASSAAASRYLLPVLGSMRAEVTLPVARSTSNITIPLPVTRALRAHMDTRELPQIPPWPWEVEWALGVDPLHPNDSRHLE